VIVLAVLVNKNTLSRLQVLMSNIRAFSQPKAQLQKLSGNDELAELDNAFREMAAERAQLDEIRKSLMAMASHDLRTPLTSMNIALEFILNTQAESLSPEVLKKMQYMSSEANRLVRLSSTFLDIEKIESGKLEVEMKKFSLGDIVEPSISAVRSLADARNIEIVDSSNKAWKLSCDQERTIQVLVNLLSNAIKFSPKNGSVYVRSVPAENDLLRVEVVDNGSGVRESESKLLFNKFSQLDQKADIKKSGSGLGLYICKMLITAQGGEIGYYPINEGGSCFWFELPALSKLS
jgi:signal transduction histidine kinase